MCGIAGAVGTTIDVRRRVASVYAMSQSLARRGPDDEGIASWDHAVLGHRRLSIFDLSSAARQPMVSPNADVGVVFNGAIYNFLELRGELEASGYTFKSRSDTEVLVHGYDHWGIDELVRRLRGMFAFAVWDEPRRTLHLVRDRLGVKPLLFWANEDEMWFASTPRALKATGAVGEIDTHSVLEFLQWGYLADDLSIYAGVRKVSAGTILTWHDGQWDSRKYWSPISATHHGQTFEEAVEHTEQLLLDAVEKRLQADVPVATLLSAGIDSSLVTWAVAKLGADLTAFTVSVPGDPWDETDDARLTAQRLGIRHSVLEMAQLCFDDLDELIAAYAEPFAIGSAMGMLRISRLVREQATVLLTGDGGDDVFLGYPRHRHLYTATRLRRAVPKAALRCWPWARTVWPRIGPLRRAAALFDYTTNGMSAYLAHADHTQYYAANNLLGPRLSETRAQHPRAATTDSLDADVLADYLAHSYQTDFVGEYMTKIDGATMHYGLEARSPFLDQQLWHFAARLPQGIRLYRGRLKAVLREITRRRLGADIAFRKKQGFGVPVQRWILQKWYDDVKELFRESQLAEEGWIEADHVLNVLRQVKQQDTAPVQLWYLIVLEKWLRYERESGLGDAPPTFIPNHGKSLHYGAHTTYA